MSDRKGNWGRESPEGPHRQQNQDVLVSACVRLTGNQHRRRVPMPVPKRIQDAVHDPARRQDTQTYRKDCCGKKDESCH